MAELLYRIGRSRPGDGGPSSSCGWRSLPSPSARSCTPEATPNGQISIPGTPTAR